MSKTITAVWQQADNNVGLEHLQVTKSSDSVLVDSVVIGLDDDRAFFRLHYKIQCDAHYQVQRVDLNLAGHAPFAITTDGAGHWFDGNNKPLQYLDGCVDIDISATPFTNTLPIRRLEWQVGQSRQLRMVYFRIPELRVSPVFQQYTCLEKNDQESRFEYQQQDFGAIVSFDADGFVQNYPELFRRLA